ncbi:hypothetical protein OG196_42860 [Kitasatospora purpeofusca]|uniref:hypothetical protein n=1 Tax=Kitasatospora purpeofusca TaxID=67352 RepID=UPI002E13936F|nr:hypothetical protein OG196_00065 [Kitasatospora purpeofusca]WSR45247.1 hypothetical protein OG196_42860 [Kitasatospora purpeofusca]
MDETTVGQDPRTVAKSLEGTVPWLVPSGLAAEALAVLDRPLLSWIQDPEYNEFDSADFYAEHREAGDKLSKLERRIAKLPVRQSWRMERVWSPDEESSEAYDAAYEKAAVTIGDRRLHPRDLDAYATIAYEVAGLRQDDEGGFDDEDDHEDGVPGELDAALEWARAGVCVLQQSLPWPFTDVLLYGELDNRPAHRILFAYADLLRRRDPKAAAVWFTALVYLNPNDNLGARFIAPGGPQYPGF